MSGRSLHHQPDGRVTVGARKTMRRNPRRDPIEKLRQLAATGPDAFPVRLVFRLPKMLEGVVSAGPHGAGVQVLSGYFVRIGQHSSEECFIRARAFCAEVARDRPAFVASAVIINAADPSRSYARFLTVLSGSMVVSAGPAEPRIYEAA